jgi:hypothetical protein
MECWVPENLFFLFRNSRVEISPEVPFDIDISKNRQVKRIFKEP